MGLFLCCSLFFTNCLLAEALSTTIEPLTNPAEAKKEIISLNQANLQSVLNESPLLVVDVYTDWCPPCKKLSPIFAELNAEYGTSFRFAKFNAETEEALANQFQITAYPTILFIKEGKEVGRETGFMNKEKLLSVIRENFNNAK